MAASRFDFIEVQLLNVLFSRHNNLMASNLPTHRSLRP
jgi:hypothetical protein